MRPRPHLRSCPRLSLHGHHTGSVLSLCCLRCPWVVSDLTWNLFTVLIGHVCCAGWCASAACKLSSHLFCSTEGFKK